MSKAVLISIKPEWCELIANGNKTIEVRKTRPKLKTPFKCYIYCTKEKEYNDVFWCSGVIGKMSDKSNGKVIGEFTCKHINTFRVLENGNIQDYHLKKLERSCLPYEKISEYIGRDKLGYSWHISDLVIYDKPRELKEFYRECDGVDNVGLCYECDKAVGEECDCALHYELHLTRPPQSWCYVETRKK